MQHVAIVMACLVCAGQGRRVHTLGERWRQSQSADVQKHFNQSSRQDSAQSTFNPPRSFAALLLTFHPDAASVAGASFHTGHLQTDSVNTINSAHGASRLGHHALETGRREDRDLSHVLRLHGGGAIAVGDFIVFRFLVALRQFIFPGNPQRERAAPPQAAAPKKAGLPPKAATASGSAALNRAGQKGKRQPGRAAAGSVIHVHSKKEFDSLLASASKKQLVVVDFFATWCGPCKQIAPKYQAMAAAIPHAKFVKVDVDECKDLQSQFGVSSMPTFKLLKGGKEVDELKGADENTLREKVQSHAGKPDRWASVGEGRTL